MADIKKTSKLLVAVAVSVLMVASARADDFMQNAREFLDVVGASAEENQDYIARSNQFTAEGEFTSEELAELFLIRAIVFSRMKDNNNALESYSAALQNKNLSPILKAEAFKNRGLLYYGNAAYVEAKNDFVRALQILSGNAELHYYLANSYFGMVEFERALRQYDLALEGMASNRFLAYYGKASIYHQQKKYVISKEFLEKSLQVRGDFQPSLDLLSELDLLTNSDELPTISSSAPQKNNQSAVKKELSPAEIYNQLLEQAFAAKKIDGKTKNINIKLNLNKVEQDNVQTASIKAAKPLSKKLKKTAVNLRLSPNNFNLQVSTTPYNVMPDVKFQRLDGLLSVKIAPTPAKIKGYFLQLSSNQNKQNIQTYYNKLIGKHKLLLAKRPYLIREFKDKKQTTNYQLLIAGFQSYKQANSLCKFLKAQNSDCFVRQIK